MTLASYLWFDWLFENWKCSQNYSWRTVCWGTTELYSVLLHFVVTVFFSMDWEPIQFSGALLDRLPARLRAPAPWLWSFSFSQSFPAPAPKHFCFPRYFFLKTSRKNFLEFSCENKKGRAWKIVRPWSNFRSTFILSRVRFGGALGYSILDFFFALAAPLRSVPKRRQNEVYANEY